MILANRGSGRSLSSSGATLSQANISDRSSDAISSHSSASSFSPRADVYIFNGSSTTANVTVNILDKDGNNLAGVAVPGSPASTYPGDAAPVPLAAAHTRDFEWLMPTVTPPAFTDVAFTVRVTSDQPVVVGSNFQFDGRMPNQCSLVPK